MLDMLKYTNGSICPNCNELLKGIGIPCVNCGRDLTYEKCKTCEFDTICHKPDNHNCILYVKKNEDK